MAENKDPQSSQDAFFPEQRSRGQSSAAGASGSGEPVDPAKPGYLPRKNKVIQPMADSGRDKENLIKDAYTAEQAPSTPVNTTTIPDSSRGSSRDSVAHSPELIQPQVPTEESSRFPSSIPVQERPEGLRDGVNTPVKDGGKTNQRVILTLLCLLLLSLTAGVAWLLFF